MFSFGLLILITFKSNVQSNIPSKRDVALKSLVIYGVCARAHNRYYYKYILHVASSQSIARLVHIYRAEEQHESRAASVQRTI